jgi:hypothetical protein
MEDALLRHMCSHDQLLYHMYVYVLTGTKTSCQNIINNLFDSGVMSGTSPTTLLGNEQIDTYYS